MALTLLPEWQQQDYVLIVWPHQYSDWSSMYHQIQKTYINLAIIISSMDKLVILSYSNEHSSEILQTLKSARANLTNVKISVIKTNDTWIRDYGPLSCKQNNYTEYANFIFNGYGDKYPFEYDNSVAKEMLKLKLVNTLQTYELILEGGSIETDGNGTLLTTTSCLLNPNRNALSKNALEQKLKEIFTLERIHWLECTNLAGDDTDGHIDNFVRFIDERTIFYSICTDQQDEHYPRLINLQKQLSGITNAHDEPYKLIPIPLPSPITNNGKRLPASYLNFLITNNSIIVPSFNDVLDNEIKTIFSAHCNNRNFAFINCIDLISQGGGLHCSTMQIAKK